MIKVPITFTLIALFTTVLTLNSPGQTTSLVSIDGNGHLTYNPDEKGNVLPDFSYVGYHHGEKPIPDVAVAKTIVPIAGDNRAHIQAAIDEVGELPPNANGHKGAVLLSAGEYEVNGTIFMRSGVVLRGMGETTIIRAVYTTREPLIMVNTGDSPGYTLIGSTEKQITDAYVPFGARTFTIESGHSFQAGDRVVMQRRPTQAWIDELEVAQYGWTAGSYIIDFFRVIEAVDGNSITIDAPVVDHMYTGIASGRLYKYENSLGYMKEVGIEDLRLETTYTNESDREHSHTAISVNAAENGWVRNVDTYHFTLNTVSFGAGAYKWTVDNCRYLRPVGTLNSGTRYSFSIGGGQQILIQNCFSDFGRHDFATGSRVAGPNVFSNSKAMNCWNVSGPHHRWATGILYDRVSTDLDLNVENRTNSGSGHGWAGANHVMWNCSTHSRMVIHDMPTDANNWAIGCIAGEGITGVGRRSTDPLGLVESEGTYIADIPILFRAQLNDRLGAGTASTDEPFPGFTGDQKVYPDELTITSAVAGNEASHHGITRIAAHSFDHDVQTRWASETSVSEAWIEYTLEGTHNIYQIKLQLFNSWIRTYPLKIEVDGTIVYNGTSQRTEEMEWNHFSFSPVSGSKVKISLTSNNSFGNADLAIHEAKIYGSIESLSTHDLTVHSGSGDGGYVNGSSVAITANEAPAGKEFDQWTGDTAAVADVYSASTTVIMPDSGIQVTATYHDLSSLTVNSGSGDGIFAPRTNVVITADEAPAGKLFDQWIGNTATVTDIYSASTTLIMPASDVYVKAVYKDPIPLNAMADAYVRGGDYAETNFGSEPTIVIKKRTANLTDHREGYIKFDLSSIPENLSTAMLKIRVNTNTGGTLHSCAFVDDDSWTEAEITYNNKPVAGSILDTEGVPNAGNWITFDVTDEVITEKQGDGIISFQIFDEIENIQIVYDSKEGGNSPIISYGSPGGSTYHTITVNQDSNGYISPGGNFTVTEGSNQTFDIIADQGYEVEDVLVDGASVGALNSYTFNNITGDHTISANFKQLITHTITASAQSNGSITPAGNVTVFEGSDQTFTITPRTGYEIEDVLVDGTSVGAVSSYTFSNVTGDHTISVSFALIANYITATADENGYITPEGNVTVAKGSNQTFFIEADPGYEIEDVLVDGTSVGALSRYTFSFVTADHTISVSFVQIKHSITANAGSNGSITPDGNITVNEGENQVFNITADPGYKIEDVLVDGTSVGALSSYSFIYVTGNHTISASFVKINHSITASAGSNGSITPDGNITVNEGEDQVFNITADPGYKIEDVLVDGASVGSVSSYTFSSVNADHTISASFVVDSTNVSAPSIHMSQTNSLINIFPNPTNGYINISGIDGKANVRIYTLLGKVLMNKQVNSNEVTLDLAQLNTGMYIIEVRDNKKYFIGRLVKE